MQRRIGRISFFALPLAALLSTAGCTQGADATGVGRQAIVGGELDPNDPAVGEVAATDSHGGVHGMTGVLVAADKVLTGPATDGEFTSLEFYVYGSDGTTIEHTYSAVSVTDPDFDADDMMGGHGIAVLTLAMGVPSSVATPLPLSTSPPVVGETVRTVGFGITSGSTSDSGVRRVLTTTITELSEGDAVFTYGDATHGGCFGDMGAPIFHSGDSGEEIVGLSFMATPECDGPSWATRIDASRAFLEEELGAIGPGAPDAGASGPDSGGSGEGGDDDGGGCRVGLGATSTPWAVALLALAILAVRRRRARAPLR